MRGVSGPVPSRSGAPEGVAAAGFSSAAAAPTRPALRWFGGKWRIAPWIVAQFPPHRVYVEPFGGAASVLLRKPRAHAECYNDMDGEVVNFFRVLRCAELGPRLIEAIRLTPFARAEFDAARHTHADPVERARRLAIYSHMGFGGNAATRRSTGFRADSTRSRTTPAADWVGMPAVLAAIAERLRGVVIENRDAAAVMCAHDSTETLHYVDPPYLWATRQSKTDYAHEMDDSAHAAMLADLRDLCGAVVLSGYRNPLYDSALADWTRIDRAALADGALKRVESLWINPRALEMRAGGTLLERVS